MPQKPIKPKDLITLTAELRLIDVIKGLDCDYADLLDAMAEDADDAILNPQNFDEHAIGVTLRVTAAKIREIEERIGKQEIAVSFGPEMLDGEEDDLGSDTEGM